MKLRLALAFTLAAAACSSKPKPATTPDVDDSPPASQPAPTAKLGDGGIVLSEPIVFEADSDTIAAQSEGVLGAVVTLLADRTDVTTVRIEGHTDSQGDQDANQALSEHRAYAVARWLVGNGVDCKRLIAVGFGATKPIADNQTPEGRDQNRRMVLAPAALRGHPIGGMPVDGGGQVATDPCN